MFVAIDNSPRPYAWGDTTAIADFRGIAPSGGPEAELWLGAHHGAPAKLVDRASDTHGDLAQWIAADPTLALGPELAAQGARLPFLLKLLAAGSPLSLQAHPNPEQARAGFERENAAGVPLDASHRNYRDPFHKPELVVAISDTFDALSGFRPLAEVRGILDTLHTADAASDAPDPEAIDLLAERLSGDDSLRTTVEWLLREGRGERGDQAKADVERLVERVVELAASAAAAASPAALSFATVLELDEAYPGDPGIVLSLLLNRVRLERGEALYLAAGNIHAHLDGLGIELMAASDNVLRGGLTPKHIDVDELLAVLDFTPIEAPRLHPVSAGTGVAVFSPGMPDFELIRVDPGADAASVDLAGPAIVIAEGGDVHVRGSGAELEVSRGAAAYITPDEGPLSVTTDRDAIAWIATTGRG